MFDDLDLQLYALLNEGKTVDELAQKLGDALNSAQNMRVYSGEQRKIEAWTNLCEQTVQFICEFYPSLGLDKEEFAEEDYKNMLTEFEKYVNWFKFFLGKDNGND